MLKNKLFQSLFDLFENYFTLFDVFSKLFRSICEKERILFRKTPIKVQFLARTTDNKQCFLPFPVNIAKVLLAFLALIVYTVFVKQNANFRLEALR